jgi:hypothetical protein
MRKQHRVAIAGLAGGLRAPDITLRAGPVVHDHLLAPELRESLCDCPPDRIGAAPWWKRNNERDRSRRGERGRSARWRYALRVHDRNAKREQNKGATRCADEPRQKGVGRVHPEVSS